MSVSFSVCQFKQSRTINPQARTLQTVQLSKLGQGRKREGIELRLGCSFCKIVFDCPDFEAVAAIQNQQCYITRKGITHKLTEVSR